MPLRPVLEKMKKKLIEVALPLEAINKEAVREKAIRHGHPSSLHLWWARRPLAACRAVLFASLVDDPSSRADEFPTEAEQDRERMRLFQLLEELVKWDNASNKQLLNAAHQEIMKSTDGHPPPVYDPFCGGGSIPLEAQRLGLEAHASDLNPVAVLITKALIEIPPKFADQPPRHPMKQGRLKGSGMWEGARGLAEDVQYYGQWMRDRAFERIGHLYPRVKLPEEIGGGEATAIAWLWARTVNCPNPACGCRMPLVRSFVLSTKAGRQSWVDAVVDLVNRSVSFHVKTGNTIPTEGTVGRKGAKCIACGTSVPLDYVRAEGRAGRMDTQLMAVVAEGNKKRIYVDPDVYQLSVARSIEPSWFPNTELPRNPRDFKTPNYGMKRFGDLFTSRQLEALNVFTNLVREAREQAISDGSSEDYALAIATYLALNVSRLVNRSSTICFWDQGGEKIQQVFARQALPMTWDFVEGNPFSDSSGNFLGQLDYLVKALEYTPAHGLATCEQRDATQIQPSTKVVFCTDPPYYDNIGYADLSDFFYVWLRKSLGILYPDLCSTLVTPKKQELVATPYRFGGNKEEAQQFFEDGFRKAFDQMRKAQHPDFPMTVFYAFKQVESDEDAEGGGNVSVASTGWETMLEGLMHNDFQVVGTWPMRTELATNLKKQMSALASSIVLVCRPREDSATITTRKDFLASLKKELPRPLRDLQKGNIAPVDLAQAAIGPGMAVFSRYKKVLESDGSAMRVRTALGLINQALDEVLSEQEGEFDPDTRWALAWFEQHAFNEGLYGEAEVLATAKALSVSGLDDTRILHSRAGKVRLLRRDELSSDWNPANEPRLTVWAVTQHLIRSLDKNGETATAKLAGEVGGLAEIARDLAYRLYILSERKGWTEEAGYYNSLVVAWPAIAPKAFVLS
jgi:putative DNA methylase